MRSIVVTSTSSSTHTDPRDPDLICSERLDIGCGTPSRWG